MNRSGSAMPVLARISAQACAGETQGRAASSISDPLCPIVFAVTTSASSYTILCNAPHSSRREGGYNLDLLS